MGYPTPETLPVETICRQLRLPDDPVYVAAFTGALLSLIDPENWELYGAVTPEQAAAKAFDIFNEYVMGTACMVGAILPYATTNPPGDCLPCDGSLYDRVDWPLLYAALDSVFIVDADTFRTPDLRGRTLIGAGSGPGLTARALGAVGGEEQHQLTASEMPSHAHTINQIILQDRQGAAELSDFVFPSLATTLDTNYTGGDKAHNNMQPWAALNYCMVAR